MLEYSVYVMRGIEERRGVHICIRGIVLGFEQNIEPVGILRTQLIGTLMSQLHLVEEVQVGIEQVMVIWVV